MTSAVEAFTQGMALRSRRRLKAAVASLTEAVRADPGFAEAWLWLGATLDNRAQETEAIPAYEKAISLGLDRTDRVKALTWLASSYSKTGNCGAAMKILAEAEASGGYEPIDEFDRISRSVRRRCRSAPSIAATA